MYVAAPLVSKAMAIVDIQVAFGRSTAVKSYPESEGILVHLCCAAAGSLLPGDNVTPAQVDWDTFQVHVDLQQAANFTSSLHADNVMQRS